MGFSDWLFGRNRVASDLPDEEKRRRRMGGLAAMAQAMSDPRYHRAGMLGPMLLAGGGAAMGNRRYEEDLYEKRQEEEERQREIEEEKAQEREWRDQQREWIEEQHRIAVEDRAREERERAEARRIQEEQNQKIREAGFDPESPTEVRLYQEALLDERRPKDPYEEESRSLQLQILRQRANEQGRPDDPTIYRSGSGYGTIGPDESGSLRYQPIPGVPEPPEKEEDPTGYVLKRIREIMTPPNEFSAMQGWKPPTREEAAEQAMDEWESARRATQRPDPAEQFRSWQQSNRARSRPRPQAGSDVGGITVPDADEGIPTTPGRVQFRGGTGGATDPQVERIVSGLPPELRDAVRQRIMEALGQGESIESVLSELQSAMGGRF